MEENKFISSTRKWVTSFIIHHNICPFAKTEYDKGSIHFELIESHKLEDQLEALILACSQLDSQPDIETTLAIFPHGLENFDDFLDFLALSNAIMHKQGYEGVYQLANFHPDYCFEGVEVDDASNYTNRSPYPLLHIIREASLEKALTNYPNPEAIPERNIKYTREMGNEVLATLLTRCKN